MTSTIYVFVHKAVVRTLWKVRRKSSLWLGLKKSRDRKYTEVAFEVTCDAAMKKITKCNRRLMPCSTRGLKKHNEGYVNVRKSKLESAGKVDFNIYVYLIIIVCIEKTRAAGT